MNPIWTAPMLGTHKSCDTGGLSSPISLRHPSNRAGGRTSNVDKQKTREDTSNIFTSILASCSHSTVLPAYSDGYPGTPTVINQTAILTAPEHWHVAGPVPRNGGLLRFWPEPPKGNDWGPMIKVIFGRLDPTAPATSEAQVQSYLEAIHIKEDETVKLERRASVQHQLYDAIPVWYLHSPQFGQRLYTEYITGDAGISVELLCDTPEELAENAPAFEFLIQSIKINNQANKARLGNPR